MCCSLPGVTALVLQLCEDLESDTWLHVGYIGRRNQRKDGASAHPSIGTRRKKIAAMLSGGPTVTHFSSPVRAAERQLQASLLAKADEPGCAAQRDPQGRLPLHVAVWHAAPANVVQALLRSNPDAARALATVLGAPTTCFLCYFEPCLQLSWNCFAASLDPALTKSSPWTNVMAFELGL